MAKVYLNVIDSDIFYRYQNFKFYFSSEATRKRFIKKLEIYPLDETIKFKIKYNIEIDDETFNLLFAFVLYQKTEKRGIKIIEVLENKECRILNYIPKFKIGE